MGLSAPTQLLLRQDLDLESRALHLINPPDAADVRALHDARHRIAQVVCFDYRAMPTENWDAAPCHFGLIDLDLTEDATVIMWVPREKKRFAMLLHWLATQLSSARLLLIGANDAGIKSANNTAKRYFQAVTKLAYGNHCQVFLATGPNPGAAYIQSDYCVQRQHLIKSTSVTVASYPGVFGHQGLDDGTALLLDNLPSLQGSVLDFGCGAGVIGAYGQMVNPQTQWTVVDVDWWALESAQATFSSNNLNAPTQRAISGIQDLDTTFDWIVTNPPFHRGKQTSYQATHDLLEQARDKLTASGSIILVANKHLDYQSKLAAQFSKVVDIAHNNKFRVLLTGS